MASPLSRVAWCFALLAIGCSVERGGLAPPVRVDAGGGLDAGGGEDARLEEVDAGEIDAFVEDASELDAPSDAPLADAGSCSVDGTSCEGRTRVTCASGEETREECPYACSPAACLVPVVPYYDAPVTEFEFDELFPHMTSSSGSHSVWTFDTTNGTIRAHDPTSDAPSVLVRDSGAPNGIAFELLDLGGGMKLGVFRMQSLWVVAGTAIVGIGPHRLMIIVEGELRVEGTIDVSADSSVLSGVGSGPGPGGRDGGESGSGIGGGLGGGRRGSDNGSDDRESGGSGASYGSRGGAGGGITPPASPEGYGDAAITVPHGGSGGGRGGDDDGGRGGDGGGVAVLFAGTSLVVGSTAVIAANGGPGRGGHRGGRNAGAGGGGGSGGAIVLAAPDVVVAPGARLLAKGGAGGAGASCIGDAGGCDRDGPDGSPTDFTLSATAGGAGSGEGAAGGAGSGEDGVAGAGGDAPGPTLLNGGGGAGRIRVRNQSGALDLAGRTSPSTASGLSTVGALDFATTL